MAHSVEETAQSEEDVQTAQSEEREENVGSGTTTAKPVRSWKRWQSNLLALVAIVLTSVGWAAASPVGSSPDEPAQIVYSWGVVTGQVTPWNVQEKVDDAGVPLVEVDVPDELLAYPDIMCHRNNARWHACGESAVVPDGEDVAETSYMDRYPPAYYLIPGAVMYAGMALGLPGALILVAARALSAVVGLLVIGAAARFASRQFGVPAALVSLAPVVTPTFLFLSASINPNGLEISAAYASAATGVALLGQFRSERRMSRAPVWLLILSCFLLAFSRPAGTVWLGIVLAFLLFGAWRSGVLKDALKAFGSAAAIALTVVVVAALAWFAYANVSRQGGVAGSRDLEEWKELPLHVRWAAVFLRFGVMLQQGYGTLGWLDTNSPTIFFLTWLVCTVFAVATLLAFHKAGGGPQWFGVGTAGAAFVTFVVAVAAQSYLAGFGWQGRYFTACIVACVAFLLPSMAPARRGDSANRPWVGAPITLTVAMLISVASAYLLEMRYVYGYKEVHIRFEDLPLRYASGSWLPIGGPRFPLVLIGLGAFLFLGLVWWSYRSEVRRYGTYASLPLESRSRARRVAHGGDEQTQVSEGLGPATIAESAETGFDARRPESLDPASRTD